MPKRPKTKFEKLQEHWYKKLEKSGFKDIESDEKHLKIWSSRFYLNYDPIAWQIKEAYYRMASAFLNDHEFESALEKTIWEYHVNGIGSRDIVKILKKVRIASNHTSICKVIRKLEHSMKLEKLRGYKEDDEQNR